MNSDTEINLGIFLTLINTNICENRSGKFVASSCVYGVDDVDQLLRRPELIGHKFYMDFEPAAYFCVYAAVRRRALETESQRRFRGKAGI